MRATFVVVLLSVIGRLGLAQQDGEDATHRVLLYSNGGYGGYGGYKGYYSSVSKKGSKKGADCHMSKSKGKYEATVKMHLPGDVLMSHDISDQSC